MQLVIAETVRVCLKDLAYKIASRFLTREIAEFIVNVMEALRETSSLQMWKLLCYSGNGLPSNYYSLGLDFSVQKKSIVQLDNGRPILDEHYDGARFETWKRW